MELALGFCVNKDSIIGNFGVNIIQKELEEIIHVKRFTQETFDDIKDCSIIGFSLYYGSHYFNLIKNLSHIDNKEEKLLFCGGISCYSPQVLEELVDIVFIGDGENVVKEVIDYFMTNKPFMTKKQLLLNIDNQHIQGVLVSGVTKNVTTNKAYPKEVYSQDTLVECAKGCKYSCRFCMVSAVSKPFRALPLAKINASIKQQQGISIPFALDFNSLPERDGIIKSYKDNNKECSISSVRLNYITQDYIDSLLDVDIRRITTSVETYDKHLLEAYKKGLSWDTIKERVTLLLKNFQSVRIYMIGNNKREDVSKNIEFLLWLDNVASKYRCFVTVSFSWFQPRPFTALQWEPLSINGSYAYKEYEFPNIVVDEPVLTLFSLYDSVCSFVEKQDVHRFIELSKEYIDLEFTSYFRDKNVDMLSDREIEFKNRLITEFKYCFDSKKLDYEFPFEYVKGADKKYLKSEYIDYLK